MVATYRGLTAAGVLDDRADALRVDLQAASEAVSTLPKEFQSRLSGGVINKLGRSVERVTSTLIDPLESKTIHPADAWARIHALRIETDLVLKEVNRVVLGAAIRADTQAGEEPAWRTTAAAFCSIVDQLLDEVIRETPLQGWSSFSVLGGTETFEHTSGSISISFPNPSFWNIAISAHEIGHYVARELNEFRSGRSINLVDELHETLDSPPGHYSWRWIEELFADAFASWAVGPAYGLTCLSFAFDPLILTDTASTHPPLSARMRLIARTMDNPVDAGFRWFSQQLTDTWEEMLDICEVRDDLTSEPAIPEAWQEKIGETLSHMPAARYSTLARARSYANDADGISTEVTMTDVVNAAWLSRIVAHDSSNANSSGHRYFEHSKHLIEGK